MRSVTEKAYAKINLYLDIAGKRDDGYHDLITVMQEISLCDEVELHLCASPSITLSCEGNFHNIDMHKNLAYIAAEAFCRRLGADTAQGVNIVLKKNIPVSAGLGGGSADAAAVLRGLNRLFGEPFTTDELCEIGMSIGSDVPFCIVGGAQICRGRGEVVREVRGLENCNILVAMGGTKLSTSEQYRILDLKYNDFVDYKSGKGYDEMLAALDKTGSVDALTCTRNIFDVLYENTPTMGVVREIMYANGARAVVLSGSGPSVFGAFDTPICEAKKSLEQQGIPSYPCRPVNRKH